MAVKITLGALLSLRNCEYVCLKMQPIPRYVENL